jgi:L-ribulose-5-phosphate 3-epimerase
MRRIGVCSWSLRPHDAADLVVRMRACGLSAVQLALDPIRAGGGWPKAGAARELQDAGVTIVSGMMAMAGEDYSTLDSIRRTGGVRMDGTWAQNLASARANAALAKQLDLTLVTFHAGFLPHDPNDPERRVMIDRLRRIADVFGAEGIDVAFETGQEDAATLLSIIQEIDRPTVGVNFDPANMILYGMGDPVAALKHLAPWVRQVHVKDAMPPKKRGEWGQEVAVGTGAVDWRGFFRVLDSGLRDVNLVIERETGESRERDIIGARQLIERHLAEGAR